MNTMENYCEGISVGTFYSLQYAMTQSKEPQNDAEKLIIVKPNGGTGSDRKSVMQSYPRAACPWISITSRELK